MLFSIDVTSNISLKLNDTNSISQGAKVLLSSHLGRPKSGYEAKFSLEPVTGRLSELLSQPISLVPDCVGMSVAATVAEMKNGDVCLLENVSFWNILCTRTSLLFLR